MNNQQKTSKINQAYLKILNATELLDIKMVLQTFKTVELLNSNLDRAKGRIGELENKPEVT